MIETAIVIANWNGRKYLTDCFNSLGTQTFQEFKIFFVDNGSTDGSIDFIRENYSQTRFQNRLDIVRFEKNTGFAKGYNAGIKKALEDKNTKYVVILNNDTKLDERFLDELVKCAERHADAGSIQPKVLNYFEKDRIDCSGILLSIDGVATNRGYGMKDSGQFEQEKEIFGANGTASLFVRKVLEEVELSDGEYFDNNYFAYYEDVDLAWRMRMAGYKSYYCSKSFLFHVHSATANKISGFKAYYLNRNRFFTLIKNYSLCRLMLILLVLTPIRYIFLLFRVIIKKGRKSAEFSGQSKFFVAKEILKAWGSVFANSSDLFKKRRAIWKGRKVSRCEIQRWFFEFKVKFRETF